jgi:hypothetical protein
MATAALLLVIWVALIAVLAPLAPGKRDALFDLWKVCRRVRAVIGLVASVPVIGGGSRAGASAEQARAGRREVQRELDAGRQRRVRVWRR